MQETTIWKWTKSWFICLSWCQLRPGVGKRGIINKRAMTIMHEVTGVSPVSPVQALTYILLLQPPLWLGNERIYQWRVFMGSRCMVSPGGDMSHVRPVYPLSHDNAPLCVLRHVIQPLYCFIKPYTLYEGVLLFNVLKCPFWSYSGVFCNLYRICDLYLMTCWHGFLLLGLTWASAPWKT